MRVMIVVTAFMLTACEDNGVRYGVGATFGPNGVSPSVSASNGTVAVSVSP